MTSALRRAFGTAAIILAAPLAPMAASAQTTANTQGQFTDWGVFVENNPKECWAVSSAKESVNTKDGKPAQVNRGETTLFVTFRPGNSGEISFTGGYPFASGSSVTVAVDGKKFEFFTDGEWAWPASAQDDAAVMAALRGGSSAVITGRSGRGTQTKDTFSLRGFTAAMNDASKRCK